MEISCHGLIIKETEWKISGIIYSKVAGRALIFRKVGGRYTSRLYFGVKSALDDSY